MSNYVAVVVKRPKLLKIQSWLKAYCTDPSEISTTKLTENTFLVVVSKGATEDVYAADRFFFKGHAVDHANKAVIFGAHGKKLHNAATTSASRHQLEGCYIHCSWNEGEIVFNNDAFAICSMLYFSESDVVAVSDSMFILTRIRRHLGLPNTPNEEALVARSWGNTMAGQLLSNETQIDQIKYATIGTTLRVANGNLLSSKAVAVPFGGTPKIDELGTYEEEIRDSVKRVSSLIHTLSQISANSVRVALSGGFDSRVVLASALKSPAARELCVFNCTGISSTQKIDYEVVRALSEKFGFPLGLRDQETKKFVKNSVENIANLWVLSNAGLYDFLYTPNFYAKKAAVFNFGGFGAEVYKGMYGWKRINKIASAIKNKATSEAFRSQATKGIGQLGIDPSDNIGSEWHYLGYRNAIHSGRATMTSMLGMRPLIQRQLVTLSRSDLNPFPAPKKGQMSMVSDMLIYANPDLAKCDFDTPDKNLKADYVENRSKHFGQLSTADIDTYTLLGKVERIHHGAPELFYNMAKTFNDQILSQSLIEEKMAAGFECLPTECRDHYAAGFEGAKEALSADGKIGSMLPSYAGKLTGIAALFA